MLSRHLARALAPALLIFLTSCGDDGDDDMTGPGVPNFAGDWSGVASFSGQGRSTGMTLSQGNRTVAGEMSVSGAFLDRPLNGQIDDLGRLVWLVIRDGCEDWSGTLTLSQDGQSATGPFNVDDSCEPTNSTTGSLSLDRQS